MSGVFFSIIIPTFNRARVLRSAIESVLNQSFKDFELLIVDDGSTDNTRETVNSIRDSRVSYNYQANKGVCAARNKGAYISKAKYLIFLDSDDELYPNALQTIYDSATKNGFPDLVFSDLEKKDLGGSVSRISARNPFGKGKEVGVYLSGAYAIKKDIFHQLGGFDEQIKFGENSELGIRVQDSKYIHCFTDTVVCIYNESKDGAGKNIANRVQSNDYIIEKHSDFFFKNKNILKLYLQSSAVLLVRMKRLKQAQIYIRRAFLATPLDPLVILRLVFIHIPFLAKNIWRPHSIFYSLLYINFI